MRFKFKIKNPFQFPERGNTLTKIPYQESVLLSLMTEIIMFFIVFITYCVTNLVIAFGHLKYF